MLLRMRKQNIHKGFTLVEVIVVLVILAILAAIMIPAMTGWIDKAKEKGLVVACRTCVVAAQTLASEEYGAAGADGVNVTGDDVIGLAKISGSVPVLALDPATAAVMMLTYQNEAGEAMTYYREQEPHYQVGGGIAQWVRGTKYNKGDTIIFGNVQYQCLKGQQSDSVYNNEPNKGSGKSLWGIVKNTDGTILRYTAGYQYVKGAIVQYSNVQYEALKDGANGTPTNNGVTWKKLEN